MQDALTPETRARLVAQVKMIETSDLLWPEEASLSITYPDARALLDAAVERDELSEELSESGRESWDMLEDFSKALDLPENIEPDDPPMRPGYPHILAAIAQLKAERDALQARVAVLEHAVSEARQWIATGCDHFTGNGDIVRFLDAALAAGRAGEGPG
jgi:hypothetical protein